MMAAEERREKARLRSERWRRAHGIMPRRPAQQPWLAEGISRLTWYWRGNRISTTVARQNRPVSPTYFLDLSRAEAFAAALARDLNDARRFTRSWRGSLPTAIRLLI